MEAVWGGPQRPAHKSGRRDPRACVCAIAPLGARVGVWARGARPNDLLFDQAFHFHATRSFEEDVVAAAPVLPAEPTAEVVDAGEVGQAEVVSGLGEVWAHEGYVVEIQ